MCMLHNHHERSDSASNWRSADCYKAPLMLIGLAAAVVVGYYLWVYHSQHVLAVLPLLFFLACPLMHLLMHRKHHHQSEAAENEGGGRREGH